MKIKYINEFIQAKQIYGHLKGISFDQKTQQLIRFFNSIF